MGVKSGDHKDQIMYWESFDSVLLIRCYILGCGTLLLKNNIITTDLRGNRILQHVSCTITLIVPSKTTVTFNCFHGKMLWIVNAVVPFNLDQPLSDHNNFIKTKSPSHCSFHNTISQNWRHLSLTSPQQTVSLLPVCVLNFTLSYTLRFLRYKLIIVTLWHCKTILTPSHPSVGNVSVTCT